MNLKKAVDRFYFDMTLNELKMANKAPIYSNITYNSLLYIDIIYFTPNCTASYIAKAVNVSKPGVTKKINELIKHGLVEKTQSTTDKRVNYLSLNEALVAEYAIYNQHQRRAMHDVQKKYTEKEIITFCAILRDIGKGYYEETYEQPNEQPISQEN